MLPTYTKTFGGTIWQNLHSVPPDNFLIKKFKMATLIISRQKSFEHHLVQKKWKWNTNSFLTHKKESEKDNSTSLLS